MEDVRANWEDAEFSDDEFKVLLDEALSKTMGPEEVSKGTVNLGVGIEEANAVTAEIRKIQTKDLQQSQQK